MKLYFLLVALLFLRASDAHNRMSRALIQRSIAFRNACKVDASCVLQSEVYQGPFYQDLRLVRNDITEGFPGIPFAFTIRVLDATTCEPLVNAVVDLWHCNATGVYSHYDDVINRGGADTTFFRGIQYTDHKGKVYFDTILAGWYIEKAVHYHMKVFINPTPGERGLLIHTGQAFFNQSIVDEYSKLPVYNENQIKQTLLSEDRDYRRAGSISLIDVRYVDSDKGISGGAIGEITVGLDVTGSSVVPDTFFTSGVPVPV